MEWTLASTDDQIVVALEQLALLRDSMRRYLREDEHVPPWKVEEWRMLTESVTNELRLARAAA